MSAKHIIPSLALLVATAAYAGPSPSPTWTHESRIVGNKVAMEVYHRAAPYALTGTAREARPSTTGDKWTRETRQLGNKASIDVYTRR